jgi:hypothetical protein
MTTIVAAIQAEFLRYKGLAEGALNQLTESDLVAPSAGGGNSIAVICAHVAGNLRSRFTDFLTSDGEKSWRNREEEFQPRALTRADLLAVWERGWGALRDALQGLSDADLARTVTIRGQPVAVHEALHRSLAHVSYHVGQVVYAARARRGEAWRFLTIPPGQSERYEPQAAVAKPDAPAAPLRRPAAPS